MAQILERLSTLPQTGAPPADAQSKVRELEQQVNDLTQHRLSHLEQMQQQQMDWQVGADTC